MKCDITLQATSSITEKYFSKYTSCTILCLNPTNCPLRPLLEVLCVFLQLRHVLKLFPVVINRMSQMSFIDH